MVCAVIDPPNGMKHGLPVSTASEPELILAFAADRASLGRAAARAPPPARHTPTTPAQPGRPAMFPSAAGN